MLSRYRRLFLFTTEKLTALMLSEKKNYRGGRIIDEKKKEEKNSFFFLAKTGQFPAR